MSDNINKPSKYYMDLANKIKSERNKEDLESEKRTEFLANTLPKVAVATSIISVALMFLLRNK
jgi:hypothetical protein